MTTFNEVLNFVFENGRIADLSNAAEVDVELQFELAERLDSGDLSRDEWEKLVKVSKEWVDANCE